MKGKGKGIVSTNNYMSQPKDENDREQATRLFRKDREAELTRVRTVGIKLCKVNLGRGSKTTIWKVLKT